MCYIDSMLLSENMKKKILNWFARQPDTIKLELIKRQRDLYFDLKEKNKTKSPEEVTLESLYHVLYIAWKNEYVGAIKEPDHRLEKIREKIVERLKRHKARKKPQKQTKLQQLEKFDSDIRLMRAQNLSYQKIAEYLQKHHNVKVHLTYIRKYLMEHP
jgi:hypothetical protein